MSYVLAKDGHKIKMGQILVQIEIKNEEESDSLDWTFLKNSFNRDGVVLTRNFFLKERIDSLKKSLIEVKSGKYKAGLLPDKIKYQDDKEKDCRVFHSACNVWKSDSEIKNFLLHSRLGFFASRLMGWDSCRINQDTFFCVQPGLGPTTFHQDNPYQDWHDSSGGVITAWIALEEVTKEMGGLEFAVGSHRVSRKGEILNEPFINSDNYRIEFENFEQTTNSSHQIVAPSFAIGDVSFHHGDLWHGSGVNNSKYTRMSFSIHLMEGSAKFNTNISPYFSRFRKSNTDDLDNAFFPEF